MFGMSCLMTDLIRFVEQIQPSLDKLSRSLKSAAQSLSALAALVDCAPLHRRYLEMTDATCRKAM